MSKRVQMVDASYALKWFLEEEGSLEARQLLKEVTNGSVELFLPQIFFFEFAAVLALKEKVPLEDVQTALIKVYELNSQTEFINLDRLLSAVKLSRLYKITVYDASYIALAQDLKIDFLTADKKLKDKVKLSFIKLL